MTRQPGVSGMGGMTRRHGVAVLGLLALATLAGIVGTALIFTALTNHEPGALIWGLPLTLGGLYWCGRALAQSQQLARRRRLMRQRG